MRDEYVGDIGDFGKYIMLKILWNLAIKEGLKIGVNWYYNTKPEANPRPDILPNGMYRQPYAYLNDQQIRALDKDVFDKLKVIIDRGNKTLCRLWDLSVLPDSFKFYSAKIPCGSSASTQYRERWSTGAVEELKKADIIFLDPDNGLAFLADCALQGAYPLRNKTNARAVKYAFNDEVEAYCKRDRSIILYQHRDYKPQDVYEKKFVDFKKYLGLQNKPLKVLRAIRYRVRDYILISGNSEHEKLFDDLVTEMTSLSPKLFEYYTIGCHNS